MIATASITCGCARPRSKVTWVTNDRRRSCKVQGGKLALVAAIRRSKQALLAPAALDQPDRARTHRYGHRGVLDDRHRQRWQRYLVGAAVFAPGGSGSPTWRCRGPARLRPCRRLPRGAAVRISIRTMRPYSSSPLASRPSAVRPGTGRARASPRGQGGRCDDRVGVDDSLLHRPGEAVRQAARVRFAIIGPLVSTSSCRRLATTRRVISASGRRCGSRCCEARGSTSTRVRGRCSRLALLKYSSTRAPNVSAAALPEPRAGPVGRGRPLRQP